MNPVGQDASVTPFNARCVASGYMWNPAFVQLTDPRNVFVFTRLPNANENPFHLFILQDDVYRQECQPHVPYRCMIGDLSGRLGNVDLGVGRYVFSDKNLPLCKLK